MSDFRQRIGELLASLNATQAYPTQGMMRPPWEIVRPNRGGAKGGKDDPVRSDVVYTTEGLKKDIESPHGVNRSRMSNPPPSAGGAFDEQGMKLSSTPRRGMPEQAGIPTEWVSRQFEGVLNDPRFPANSLTTRRAVDWAQTELQNMQPMDLMRLLGFK